ncbi:hypothetical protein JDV02_000589 [Purpureocillium takamizusanense]|uniref:Uncharacterized protein n=1 Tax=Purpureocillium takamizusanense TaxID=2060973 RepID=A0A9Q8V5P1_9HYPO|nr:uncharacterized protein JDV02_000589 [Purpureocillium takamizusanense]UNI13893.1 hypothetical protein JDV02_000589 [Purpureocillium takamizusanense]
MYKYPACQLIESDFLFSSIIRISLSWCKRPAISSEHTAKSLQRSPDTMSSESNEYVSRQGDKSEIPVQADDSKVEDPIDETTANSDAQLERDDAEAIDKSNIIKDRTRHAEPQAGYREPGDNEGIPTDD